MRVKGLFSYYEYEDGSIKLEYEDYDTESDWSHEVHYSLDAENAEKLRNCLPGEGNLKERITNYFGERLDKASFDAKCKEWGIEANSFVWHWESMD